MKNLSRRVQKLERTLTDSSGLIPDSEAWWDYWMEEAGRILQPGYTGGNRMPIDVARAYMLAGTADDPRPNSAFSRAVAARSRKEPDDDDDEW